ncbi:MAG: hypothetical protein DRH93_03385 [Deltaproteobacteria bacterium]|nr:MAG: hypothetical protein DRH93_03385 [Deltaproteobacteria bacterium]
MERLDGKQNKSKSIYDLPTELIRDAMAQTDPLSAEKELWSKVLYQVTHDLRSKKYRRSAIVWLRDRDPVHTQAINSFVGICDMLGLKDYDSAAEILIKKEFEWRPEKP